MKHLDWLLHFGANYIETAATFDGECGFCLIAKNKQKQIYFPTLIFFGSNVPLLSDIYHKWELDMFLNKSANMLALCHLPSASLCSVLSIMQEKLINK